MAAKLSRTASRVYHLFILYGLAVCSDPFPDDVLTPYTDHHGSRRNSRDVQNCKHVSWENETFEVFKLNVEKPLPTARIQVHQFADSVSDRILPGNLTRYLRHTALGSIAFIDDPYYMLSVLEPNEKGGCKKTYFSVKKSTVRETASKRPDGCKVAVNAGFFKMTSGECLGNIVADGRLVQTSNDEQNANFGIRQDGSIVVGYLPDSEIFNTTNPFRQLVTGVVWLVRNGSSFVRESIQLECASHEDTGRIETFANVLSARTAVGHDSKGRVVIVQVDGQTHRRGVNLWQFADLLIAHGLVNAINLDGGGSSTFIHDSTLANHPSDHCPALPEYRCERPVTTILCAHDAQCLDPLCNQRGSCDNGLCSCDPPWMGEVCDTLNCSLTNCSNHGNCSEGVCSCEAGWMGPECSTSCPQNRYGPGCVSSCWCYGRSSCDRVTGKCLCPPGYISSGCWRECPTNKYGQDCLFNCSYPDCSGHGKCSPVNGSCICEAGWSGPDCNTTLVDTLDSILEHQKPQPNHSSAVLESTLNVTSIQPSSPHFQTTTLKLVGTPFADKDWLGNPLEETNLSSEPPTLGDSTERTHPQSHDTPLRDSARLPNEGNPPPVSHDQSHNQIAINQEAPTYTDCTATPQKTVGVIIGITLSSVLIHILLCLWTHRTVYTQLCSWYDSKIRSKISRAPSKKRRKRRRRQYFAPIEQDSSSDCSI